MKKILCTLMAVLMVCGCFGCSSSEPTTQADTEASPTAAQTTPAPTAALQVGYGRKDINPLDPVPLAGYGNTFNRISVDTLDNLYVTCVAIADAEGNTVLLLTQDLINSSLSEEVRAQISSATGLSKDHIMLAATHTHSAPDQGSTNSAVVSWKTRYVSQCVKAAEAALEDLSSAEISVAKTETEGLNFVRHYLMNDGTYAGDNFGVWTSGTKDHAEENDPGMQLIRFTRNAEDKKDVLLVNWQAHPCKTGGNDKTDISADFIGSTRAYVEQQADVNFAYFTGAAGNQNASSRIAAEAPTQDNKEFGKLLGDYVLKAMENMEAVASGSLQVKHVPFEGQIDMTMQDKLVEAREVYELQLATDQLTANALAQKYGFSSCHHARAILNRSAMGKSQVINTYVISVGDISFVTAPYEMFAAHGVYIKDNSPFSSTFIISCANGSMGYIPTNLAYDYGCYESHTGRFARGTGDELAESFVSALNELKK